MIIAFCQANIQGKNKKIETKLKLYQNGTLFDNKSNKTLNTIEKNISCQHDHLLGNLSYNDHLRPTK